MMRAVGVRGVDDAIENAHGGSTGQAPELALPGAFLSHLAGQPVRVRTTAISTGKRGAAICTDGNPV